MIAMKREVATTSKDLVGFPWSECQVTKLTTSHCTEYSLQKSRNDVWSKNFLWSDNATHTGECTVTACRTEFYIKYEKEATFFMATTQVMRITLKAYDHQLVDASAKKLIDTVKKSGATVSGPVPLPTKKEVVTILRAVHKYKDSREQFEQRTHKRLIDVIAPTAKTTEAMQRLDMPAGVYIDIAMKTK